MARNGKINGNFGFVFKIKKGAGLGKLIRISEGEGEEKAKVDPTIFSLYAIDLARTRIEYFKEVGLDPNGMHVTEFTKKGEQGLIGLVDEHGVRVDYLVKSHYRGGSNNKQNP
ncbi:hypothetical protein ACFLZJ_01545 [Nanoarchaeota archaeon]